MAYRFPPTSLPSSLPHCSRISFPSTPFHLLLPPVTAQISSLAFPSKTVCQCDSSDSGLIIDLRNASNSVKDCGVDELKASLFQALQGVNRGIFGVPSKTTIKIHSLIELIESHNPLPKPTASLEKVAGDWRLKYSTISILGSKRTKLGLRDFVTLGDFIQTIDIGQDKATNIVSFSVAALGRLTGALIVEATYKVTTSTRVDIRLENSSINPKQLQSLFRENYDMLLDIFNPEGWLEITYVDDSIRIGRDDKGNIFVLEKVSQSSA